MHHTLEILDVKNHHKTRKHHLFLNLDDDRSFVLHDSFQCFHYGTMDGMKREVSIGHLSILKTLRQHSFEFLGNTSFRLSISYKPMVTRQENTLVLVMIVLSKMHSISGQNLSIRTIN